MLNLITHYSLPAEHQYVSIVSVSMLALAFI